jgi:hypothetical protein
VTSEMRLDRFLSRPEEADHEAARILSDRPHAASIAAAVLAPRQRANMESKWKEVRGGKRCLHRILGKRCDSSLYCDLGHVDHTSLWCRKSDRELMLITQPYGINGDRLLPLLEFSRCNNLRVFIDAKSFWYPGATIEIAFMRKDAPL